MKYKLLVFHPAIAPYRIDFFNSLNQNFEMVLCLFHDNLIDQKFDTSWIQARYTFTPQYMKHGFRIWGRTIRWGVSSLINQYKPNIVCIPEYGIASIAAVLFKILFRKKYKTVVLCDDSFAIATHYGKIRGSSRRFILKHSSGIILCNPKAQQWYDNKFHIPSFLFPILQEDNEYRNRLQRALPLTNQYIEQYHLAGKKVILYVGRFAKVKNLPFLIDAFKEIVSQSPQTCLILIGAGDQKNDLKSMVKTLGLSEHVLFPGRFENIQLLAWYNLATLFVLPSSSEPFGTVTNEALLAGAPSLISEKAGSSFLTSPDNVFPLNKSDLVQLIQKRLSENQTLAETANKIRPSLMKKTYQEYMQNLVSWMNAL